MEMRRMARLLTVVIIFIIIANYAWAGTYKWVDKNGKSHYTNNLGSIPMESRSTVKQLSGATSKKKSPVAKGLENASETGLPNTGPATKEEKTRLKKKIFAAYKIKNPAKRKKAFINLFYLEGVETEMLPRFENVMVGNMMSLINPKVSFSPLPKDYSGIYPIDGEEYINNLAELGTVLIKGVTKILKIDRLFPAKIDFTYGRKGDELFFPGFVPR